MEKYICAIDSSLSRSGIAIFSKKEKLIFYSSIPTSANLEIQKRLGIIGETLTKIRKKYPCDTLVIEEGFCRYHNATKALFRVRGVIEFIFRDCEIYAYSPRTIKRIVGGDAKAEKDAVAEGVMKLYPKVKLDGNFDTSDAIATGISFFRIQAGDYVL